MIELATSVDKDDSKDRSDQPLTLLVPTLFSYNSTTAYAKPPLSGEHLKRTAPKRFSSLELTGALEGGRSRSPLLVTKKVEILAKIWGKQQQQAVLVLI